MAVDLWSLGCVAFKILTKSVPFPDVRALRRFCRSQSPFPIGPLADVGLSREGIDFVKILIVADPKARAIITTAQGSEWLRNDSDEATIDSSNTQKSSSSKDTSVDSISTDHERQLSVEPAKTSDRE